MTIIFPFSHNSSIDEESCVLHGIQLRIKYETRQLMYEKKKNKQIDNEKKIQIRVNTLAEGFHTFDNCNIQEIVVRN